MQTTDDVQLRAASPADCDQVATLLKRCGLPSDDTEQIIEAFHVALDKGGRIVGCVAAEPLGKSIVVRTAAVDALYRDRGIASRLIETLLVRARGTGAHEAYLLSTAAPAYFARWGFSLFPADKAPPAVRGSTTFRHAERTSALCMRCELR
jgi:amino-acid N-acetyltransferase